MNKHSILASSGGSHEKCANEPNAKTAGKWLQDNDFRIGFARPASTNGAKSRRTRGGGRYRKGRTTLTYDAEGQKVTTTDPLGRVTSYAYSNRGLLATVTDPVGDLMTYTYSPTGKMSAEYHVTGSQLTSQGLTYDADDRLLTSNDGAGCHDLHL